MRYNIIKLDSIDSTSIWARKNLAQLNDFDVVCANIQTNGHGQFERNWYSTDKNGGNIYITIVLKPENIEHLNELTRYTSYIVSLTLSDYGLKSDFKFPNDVLIGGKKICGVLAESVFVGSEFKGVVVGVGINLNLRDDDFDKIDIKATSVYNEIGRDIDRDEFLNRLMNRFENLYDDFLQNGLKQELAYI